MTRTTNEDRQARNKMDRDRERMAAIAASILATGPHDFRPFELRITPVNPGEIIALEDESTKYHQIYPEGEFFRHEREVIHVDGQPFQLLRIIPTLKEV